MIKGRNDGSQVRVIIWLVQVQLLDVSVVYIQAMQMVASPLNFTQCWYAASISPLKPLPLPCSPQNAKCLSASTANVACLHNRIAAGV